MFRNLYLDVYISGFLECDDYLARDAEQLRQVCHVHVVGSGGTQVPKDFRLVADAYELATALGGKPERDIEGLNKDPQSRRQRLISLAFLVIDRTIPGMCYLANLTGTHRVCLLTLFGKVGRSLPIWSTPCNGTVATRPRPGLGQSGVDGTA